MRNKYLSLVVVASLLLVSAVAASAQSATRLKVQIPFEFVAGDKTMPAGEYDIQRGAVQGVLALSGAEPRTAAFLVTHVAYANSGQHPSQLVFNRYGNSYFLSEAWWGEAGIGLVAAKSRVEREMATSASAGPLEKVILRAQR